MEKDRKGTELIRYKSELIPEGEYYFITEKYLYSKIPSGILSPGPAAVYAYGVNDKNGKIILTPQFLNFPDFVKISEYGEDGKLHEAYAWWTLGRIRSSRILPFIEEDYTQEFFTPSGNKYQNKNKKYCIVKVNFNAYLMDLKRRGSIFRANEMDWKSKTEIVYEPINSDHNEIPKIEIKFTEKKWKQQLYHYS